jgi:hypothetical protein
MQVATMYMTAWLQNYLLMRVEFACGLVQVRGSRSCRAGTCVRQLAHVDRLESCSSARVPTESSRERRRVRDFGLWLPVHTSGRYLMMMMMSDPAVHDICRTDLFTARPASVALLCASLGVVPDVLMQTREAQHRCSLVPCTYVRFQDSVSTIHRTDPAAHHRLRGICTNLHRSMRGSGRFVGILFG